MRTRLGSCLLILVVAVSGFAAENPLAEPQKRLLHGNYDEARSGFAAVAQAHPEFAPQAAIGVSRCYQEIGEYEKSLTTLNLAVKNAPDHPDLLAERADRLYALGRWDEAEKEVAAALAQKEDQLRARYTQARLFRERGLLDEADQAFRWVVRYYTARSNADNDITDAEELVIVAACGAENARWHKLPRQFRFILNEVLADALKNNPDYWPAEQMAGDMLLEKYNRPGAIQAYDNALKINPKAVEPLVGKGRAALAKFDIAEAEQLAEQALRHNPQHPAALRLMADVERSANQWPAAVKHLRTAQQVNPRDAATLGRLAAMDRLMNKKTESDAIIQNVSTFDKKPGIFFYELAECLEEHKRYAEAETFYLKAAELRPQLAGPRTGLGMLYLRLGKEKEGRELLTQAFASDPFHVRVANSLKVLRHLDDYETITTPHYELRFNPKTDKLLAAFVADYLEESHAELKRQFQFEPSGRILIEVFSTHEMFSGRTVGLPDLHTIGACTGRVIAMASPHAKGIRKPFNWGRVIRHELTHVFNLAQTDFLCPHWLTEGLAVRNENMSRPRDWSVTLRERMENQTLFNLDTVMLGFVRPKSPEEWTLAYCQSQLYVEYLVQTYGEACIGKLLNAYGQGLDTAEALRTAVGVEQPAFEKGYRAYLETIMKPYRRSQPKPPAEKQLTFAELEAAQKQNPDDVDLMARLADQLYRRNKFTEARQWAEKALTQQPNHPIASVVQARLLSRDGQKAAAAKVLQAAWDAHPADPKLLLALARYYTDAKDYTNAAKVLEQGRRVAPLESDWLEQLARIYKQTDDTDKLISVLKEIIAANPDELAGRVLLAKTALAAGKPAEAERFAREAIQIDVTQAEAQSALVAALRQLGRDDAAQKLEARFQQ
ncbi:MAG: tetratricopeptide repeat protein [Bacteroidales bacterium]|nr:tetratricopeptide repeat protein [Bacteroidales bacterium]